MGGHYTPKPSRAQRREAGNQLAQRLRLTPGARELFWMARARRLDLQARGQIFRNTVEDGIWL